MTYTTEDFPIKLGYWYIVALGDFSKVTLYPVYFLNRYAAKRALASHVAVRNRDRYSVITGSKLKQYTLEYRIRLGPLHKFTKYEYPPSKLTLQERKTFRTVQRRRLRRMGMLVRVRSKFHIKKKVPQARHIVNKQKVADSPNTMANVFRLERKPKKFYYIIINKVRSKKKGILFEVEALRFNSKNGVIKELFINIFNQDIVIPHLLSQVYSLANNKSRDLYERIKKTCRSKGVGVYKERKKDQVP